MCHSTFWARTSTLAELGLARPMRKATLDDLERLVELMAEFYAESGYRLSSARAHQAFLKLLSDNRLGHIWLIQSSLAEVGYAVVTLGYSMEYGGRDAFVDDLFIRPP